MWTYCAGDSDDFIEQGGGVSVQTGAFTGDANIRARESRMEAIHSSRPGGWIEQPDISFVHVQVGEPAIGGSLSQHGAAIGVVFDGADGVVSKYEV